jgi:hypothetical protein
MSKDMVTYTFVKKDGGISFQSKVASFNLDHVTEKDSISFFKTFSNFAAMDTGLLPVDGTGMLALRKAGNHTQVTFQHKPGLYYVNWGAHEGDKAAVSYLVAQPYRIVIIDFVDDNLLGARTFYSPIPATHPGIQLYHVNLPNINCRGYRGNGVGWICLYHNQDWSQMPFNERLARAIERCSGIETYNDANMSETDGPRFYRDHYKANPDFAHIWSPKLWESKSQEEGFDWTLDENLWIPIMVKSKDEQDAHYFGEGAIPLTLADAITGRYNAYYNDSYHPKPINALTNPSIEIDPKSIMNWFVQSYNSSKTNYVGIDTLAESAKTRETIATNFHQQLPLHTSDEEVDEDDDEDDLTTCYSCSGSFGEDDVAYIESLDDYFCHSCLEDNFVWCENTQDYLKSDSPHVYWSEASNSFHNLEAYHEYKICSCTYVHGVSSYALIAKYKNNWIPDVWQVNIEDEDTGITKNYTVCSHCIDENVDDIEVVKCPCCKNTSIPSTNHYPISGMHLAQVDSNNSILVPSPNYNDYNTSYVCSSCTAINYSYTNCSCGKSIPAYSFRTVINPVIFQINEANYPAAYQVITDQVKSMELNVHDEYLLTLNNFCINCVYSGMISKNSSVYSQTISEIDSNKHYWIFKDIGEAEGNYERIVEMITDASIDGSLFSQMLNNGSFSIVPLSEAF